MICYQDEKTYGPPVSTMSKEQLDAEIEKLELELYGQARPYDIKQNHSERQMIYDIKQKKYVPINL